MKPLYVQATYESVEPGQEIDKFVTSCIIQLYRD